MFEVDKNKELIAIFCGIMDLHEASMSVTKINNEIRNLYADFDGDECVSVRFKLRRPIDKEWTDCWWHKDLGGWILSDGIYEADMIDSTAFKTFEKQLEDKESKMYKMMRFFSREE